MTIPNAKQSPRIDNGILMFYKDDTFTLQIELEMTDQDGVAVEATGEVDVVFRDDCHEIVKQFSCTPVDNVITLEFTEDVSALFPIGTYTYDMYYNGEYRTTIANDNKVVVE